VELPSPPVLPVAPGQEIPVLPVQVLDQQGKPFAGVSWTLWVRDRSGMGGRRKPPTATAPEARGIADAQGRFDVPLAALPPALGRLAIQTGMVDLELVLRHPQLADAHPASQIPSSGEWQIHLPRTDALAVGHVLTPQGEPAARAELRVDGQLQGWTDVDGGFRLDLPTLVDGPFPKLQAFHPAGILQRPLDRAQMGELRLETGLALSGRVQSQDGQGIQDVVLLLSRVSGPAGGGDWGPFQLPPIVTDAGGNFAVQGLQPGKYRVAAQIKNALRGMPDPLALQLDGAPLQYLLAGQQGLRLETRVTLLSVSLAWPSGIEERPRWVSWNWQPANWNATSPVNHFQKPPTMLQQIWSGAIPAEGLDLVFQLKVEGFLPMEVPLHLIPEKVRYQLELRPKLLDGVGSLRLDLKLPPEARGWQLDYRVVPLDGQDLAPKLLRFALPSLDPSVQPTLLLDLPRGRYQVLLADPGDGAFRPPDMRIAGSDEVRVDAGQLQRWELALELAEAGS